MGGRPNGAFGDVLVNAVELVSVSGTTIANINIGNEDWSTYRVRLTAAGVMKVAPKFVNLADESGRAQGASSDRNGLYLCPQAQ